MKKTVILYLLISLNVYSGEGENKKKKEYSSKESIPEYSSKETIPLPEYFWVLEPDPLDFIFRMPILPPPTVSTPPSSTSEDAQK